MPKLNYRRGLQRVYALGSIAWIALVLGVAVHDRPITDWQNTDDFQPLTDADIAKLDGAREGRAKAGAAQTLTSDQLTAPPHIDKKGAIPTFDEFNAQFEQRKVGATPFHIVKSEPLPNASQLPYWSYRTAIALLPPGLSYLLFFSVLPWVGRGFLPGSENSK